MSSNSCEIMASEFYYRAANHPFPPVDRAAHTQLVVNLRTAMGEPALAAAWAVGHALSPGEAIALACQLDATVGRLHKDC